MTDITEIDETQIASMDARTFRLVLEMQVRHLERDLKEAVDQHLIYPDEQGEIAEKLCTVLKRAGKIFDLTKRNQSHLGGAYQNLYETQSHTLAEITLLLTRMKKQQMQIIRRLHREQEICG
jgi:hypothetical protein